MQFASALLAKGKAEFERDVQAWGLTRRSALMIALFPIVLIAFIALLAILSMDPKSSFRAVFRWATAEDSVLEWLQFLLVFGSGLALGWVSMLLLRGRLLIVSLLYLALAFGVLFVAGEEISWGQRVFGWETPDSLADINHQNETNIHNIRAFQFLFGVVLMIGSAYAAFAPLVRAALRTQVFFPALSHLMIPPLFLIPAFLMPFGYRFVRLFFWPETQFIVVKFGEAPELCLYFGLFMFTYLNLRRLTQARDVSAMNTAPAN